MSSSPITNTHEAPLGARPSAPPSAPSCQILHLADMPRVGERRLNPQPLDAALSERVTPLLARAQPRGWPIEESFPDEKGLRRLTDRVSGRQTWALRYRCPLKGSANLATLGPCDTMDEIAARVAAREMKRLIAQGVSPVAPRLTVGLVYDHVYEPWAQQHKRSWRDDRSRFNRVIRPVLGNEIADDLRPQAILQLAEDLLSGRRPGPRRDRYTEGSVNLVIALLKAIYREGVRAKVLSANPARDVRLLRLSNHRRVIYTDVDLAKLLPALRDAKPLLRLLVVLLLATSARIGELLGARHCDVDVVAGTLHVARAKNGRPVDLPLSEVGLAAYRELQTLAREGNPHLFPARHGSGPMSPPRKALNQLLQQLGIPHRTFHDMRRTGISTAVQLPGVTLLDASRLANHAGTRITEERYVVLPQDRIRQVATAVGDRLNLQLALQPSPSDLARSDAPQP